MDITHVETVLITILATSALALLLVLGAAGYAATSFFGAHRPVRQTRQEPVLRYYRQVARSL